MRRRVRYEPSAEVVAGEFYGTIQADLPAGEAVALRLARALHAVVIASRAWAKVYASEGWTEDLDLADRRLWAAHKRLEEVDTLEVALYDEQGRPR